MTAESIRDRVRWLRGQRAVRDFTPAPASDEAIADILEVGRWTGSAMNEQSWEFIVIRDRQTLQDLAAISPNAGHLAGAAFAIAIVLPNKNEVREAYDEGRLVERMILAGSAHGLGSCIGWFNNAERERGGKERLGIPAEMKLRTAISFGEPDRAAIAGKPRRAEPRKPAERIVHAERYRRD